MRNTANFHGAIVVPSHFSTEENIGPQFYANPANGWSGFSVFDGNWQYGRLDGLAHAANFAGKSSTAHGFSG